jgi:hypothetical protein
MADGAPSDHAIQLKGLGFLSSRGTAAAALAAGLQEARY